MASSLALSVLLILLLSLSDAEIETHLHFYLHDTVTGSDPTAVRVASGESTSSSSPAISGFGSIVMMDDPLTEQPDPGSRLVGRAQGMYALASKEETSAGLLMAMNLVFLDDDGNNGGVQYNGSTIAVLGRNDAMADVREMAVVGGSGYFRLARGYALARTNQLDRLGGNAVVEYDVHVLHL